MQQVLLVEFRVKAEHVSAFDTAIRANAAASVANEPGCRLFDVCRSPSEPELFVLYEIYDDDAAVQAHLKAPHFLSFDAATAAWVVHKRVQRLNLSPNTPA